MAYSKNHFIYRNTPKLVLLFFIVIIVLMFKSFFQSNNDSQPRHIETKRQIAVIDTTKILKTYLNNNCYPHTGIFSIKDTINENDSTTYIIKSTLDSNLQKLCDIFLNRYHPVYGAIVVTNATNGEIKGLMSYANIDSCDFQLAGNFTAFDSRFPTASTFKTVTLYSYLSNSKNSLTDMYEYPGRSTTLYRYQIDSLKTKKYSYREQNVIQAYAQSSNPVFGKIGIDLGKECLINNSQLFLYDKNIELDLFKMKKSNLLQIDTLFNLAELGSGFNKYTTASPMHASLLFAPVINSGYIPKPKFITSITANDSSINWHFNDSIIKLSDKFSKKALAGLKEASMEVVEKGTARKKTRDLKRLLVKYPDWEIGGKTGNVDGITYEGRTDWFIGYFSNKKLDINYTISVMQVHGDKWNMHSTYIASEIMRRYIILVESNRKEQKSLKNTLKN